MGLNETSFHIEGLETHVVGEGIPPAFPASSTSWKNLEGQDDPAPAVDLWEGELWHHKMSRPVAYPLP